MKRLYVLFFIVVLIFSLTACNEDLVKGSIVSQASDTTAELDIMPQKLFELAEIGDVVVVTAGNFKSEMPLVDKLIAEDGKLQLFYDSDKHSLIICAYNQNIFENYNLSIDAKVKITKK